jgi:hypothetical protein
MIKLQDDKIQEEKASVWQSFRKIQNDKASGKIQEYKDSGR